MSELENFVKEQTTSIGTGDISLSNITGFRRFQTAFATGGTDVFFYSIIHQSADEWEIGTGHLVDSTTLRRDTVLDSSNNGFLVTFTAGDKFVLVDLPADFQSLVLDIGNDGTIDSDTVKKITSVNEPSPAVMSEPNPDEIRFDWGSLGGFAKTEIKRESFSFTTVDGFKTTFNLTNNYAEGVASFTAFKNEGVQEIATLSVGYDTNGSGDITSFFITPDEAINVKPEFLGVQA